MQIKTMISEAFHSLTVALNVAWATIVTGILTVFDVFAHHAGVMASISGFLLTSILIVVNIRTLKKTNLEIELLERRKEDKQKKTGTKAGQ